MASRRRTTSLFVVVLGLGSALLSGNALPQGYQTRFSRSHRCPTCPRDCSEKLAGGGTAEIVIDYPQPKPTKPHYPAPPVPQPLPNGPHPTPAPYVIAVAQPQPQYSAPPPHPQPQYSTPPSQPHPQYSAPPPHPQYTSPPQRPQYSAPQPRPHYAAPRPPVQPYQPIQQQYLSQIRPSCDCPDCPPNFDPYDYPGYDYEYGGYRCGRSLDSDDSYPMFGKYNRRSVDLDSKKFAPKKEYSLEPLPFADESGPPADFYKNYRPYMRESTDRREDDSEEQPSRRSPDTERERLFVVYRADDYDDKPSDSELESVIRQAMDVARQQKSQEDFAKARKPKSVNRYRYEHEKYQDDVASERVDFEALKEDKVEANGGETRFNLSPGPLMNDDTFVTEDGDDTLNPGTDQSKWTIVPSLTDLELVKPQVDDVEEIEAAVSVVPEVSKAKNIMKVPKVVPKDADVGKIREKVKKETIEVVRADEVEKKVELVTDLMEDIMQMPSVVTEPTNFERPVESSVTWAPTTNASLL